MSINNAECPECGQGFHRWDKNDPKTCSDCTIKLQQAEIERLTAEVETLKEADRQWFMRCDSMKAEINRLSRISSKVGDANVELHKIYSENAALRAEVDESYTMMAGKDDIILDAWQDIDDLACLYEQIFYAYDFWWSLVNKAVAENAKLREALGFYADEKHHRNRTRRYSESGEYLGWFTDIEFDDGAIARAARGEA